MKQTRVPAAKPCLLLQRCPSQPAWPSSCMHAIKQAGAVPCTPAPHSCLLHRRLHAPAHLPHVALCNQWQQHHPCIPTLASLLALCRGAAAHGVSVSVDGVFARPTTAQQPPSVLVAITVTCSPVPGKGPNAGPAVCDALSALPDATDCFANKLLKPSKPSYLQQAWNLTSCSVAVSAIMYMIGSISSAPASTPSGTDILPA
jgi:hypothetical protein